jgi:hypothetical protein
LDMLYRYRQNSRDSLAQRVLPLVWNPQV